MSTYDPGEPYDGPPPRRRRHDYRRESEYDDAWAAANEDALDDGDLSVEDLAAGYVWEDRDRYGVEHRTLDDEHEIPGDDLGAFPRPPRRARPPRDMSRGDISRRDISRPYTRSPSYHRDRARRGEYAEYWGASAAPAPARNNQTAAPRGGVPFWHILLLVILVLFAVLAVTLACVSALVLL